MKYIVNKDTKTIELLPSIFTADELSYLMEQFEDYYFSVSFSPKKAIETSSKLEKQGMIIGATYISIIGNIEHS